MSDQLKFKTALFGYQKSQIQDRINQMEKSSKLTLQEQENTIAELSRRCQTMQSELDHFREQNSELEKAKEELSRSMIETTQRMERMTEEANRNAEQAVSEAEEKAASRIAEADQYHASARESADEHAKRVIAEAEEYRETTLAEADRTASGIVIKAKEDYESRLEDARNKSDQMIAEAYAFAEKERSEMEREIEEKRENLVSLKQAAKGLKDDVRAAMGLFELKIVNTIEKTNQNRRQEEM